MDLPFYFSFIFWSHHLFLNILLIPDSRPVLEALILTFERLHAELHPVELSFIWKCLLEKIERLTNENSIHLTRLLTLLISVVQNDYLEKITGRLQVVHL